MARRVAMGQGSLAEALLPAALGSNHRLEGIASLLDWAAVEVVLAGLRSGERGAPPYPAVLMFRALLLQQWYGLSDPGLEEALNDRLSFRRFVGLGMEVAAPDHATLWRFREALAGAGLDRAAFAEVNRQLDARGLVVRAGTLIDATLIAAQSSPPPKGSGEGGASKLLGTPREPDANWTRRGRRRHFGYKAHIAVDLGSALVRDVKLTGASVNDTVIADDLVQGDERAVYGDKAYGTHDRRRALRARRIKPRLMHRGNKHHPLTPRQTKANKLMGRVRGRVETAFAVLKQHYDKGRARYLTLARNAADLLLGCTAMNLRRAFVLTS
jgi:IS5 family transposase